MINILINLSNQIRNSVHPIPFWLDESADVAAQLEAAAEDAAASGHPIRALLLTNPNNPLGIIHRESSIRAMLRWALNANVHLVSDEIYALTVHTGDERFKSTALVAGEMVAAGELPQERVDAYLHLLWGLSKDFGASGLRLGVLHSRNACFKQA